MQKQILFVGSSKQPIPASKGGGGTRLGRDADTTK